MEFKFRAVDERPPPRPPIFTSFSEPSLPSPMLGNSFTPMLPLSNTLPGFPSSEFRPNLSPICNPNNARGLFMHDIEQERIRDEIIMGEIARRRELEAEVRHEIMLLEREMAMRRAALTGGLSFGGQFAPMQFSARPALPLNGQMFADQLLSMQRSASPRPLLGHPSISEPIVFPLPPSLKDVTTEFKASTEPNKDKWIMLAKPDPKLCGTKRKAVVPPTSDPNELHPFGLKKKPQAEWSCALCQVSATSEKVLNDHLQGKKHMVMEAKLQSQNANNALARKKTESSAANSKPEEEAEEKTPGQNEPADASEKEKNEEKDFSPKNILKDKSVGDLKTPAGSDGAVGHKFWCEMCRVGALSSKVMEDHKKGKKHLAKLRVSKYKKGSEEAASRMTRVSTQVIVPKPEATEVVASLIPKPKAPNKSNETVSKTSNIIEDPNKTNEDISPKASIIPKQEDCDIASKPDQSNKASSESTHAITEAASGVISLNVAIIQKLEDPNLAFERGESNKASSESTLCLAASGGISLNHVTIPKREDPGVASEPYESDKASEEIYPKRDEN